MAYQSLYRRYRSQRFGEIVGQPHVVAALSNAVRDGRVGHAYLFSGPRGTGKTSTARILAKALNCTDLAEGEPCGVCVSCKTIEAGTSYDLFELDAASNNKVEDIRDLISRVAIGSPGRTKVYILDEVHMLSPAASNVLLKTLEEPPDHVTFVLATTDPQKVLPTIRSRTQHFEFGLIPAADLERHIRWVVADAGLPVDDEAVAWVVRKGAGSARDALSALDQVAAAGGVGNAAAPLDELVEALCHRDGGRALVGVAAALAAGREPRLLAEDLLGRLREAFLAAVAPALCNLPEHEAAAARDTAARVGPAGLTRALESIGEALVEMRQAPDARVTLEVALVRLTRPDLDASVAALVERVTALEAALADGAPLPAGAPVAPAEGSSPGAAPRPSSSRDDVSAPTVDDSPAPGDDVAATGPASRPAAPARPARPGSSRPLPTASATNVDAAAREGAAAVARRRLAASRGEATGGVGSARVEGAPGRGAPGVAAVPGPDEPRPDDDVPSVGGDGDAPLEARRRDDADRAGGRPRPVAETTATPPGPTPTSTGQGRRPVEAGPGRRQDPSGSEADAPAGTLPEPAIGASPAVPPAGGETGAPTVDELGDAWSTWVLEHLPPPARALFKAGRFVGVEGGTALFGLPNRVHRDRCEARRPEVEARLAERFGRPVPLRLVVMDGGSGGGGVHDDDPGPAPDDDPLPSPDELSEIGDVHALRDANDVASTAVDRLMDIFPGSEVVE